MCMSLRLEGFRVLTLVADVDGDVLEYIRRYQVLASHLFWAKKLGIKPSEHVLERVRKEIKSYWRWHLIDEGDPMYLFKGVEETPTLHTTVLKLPLVDALHPNKGAYINGDKLVLRLNKRVEISIPKRALEWLSKRLAENPDKKTVRVFERDGKLVAQVVLHKVNIVEKPANPLLVVVDINSSYGIAVHYWDEKLIKTEKYRPPNKSGKWRTVRKLMGLRDNLCSQGAISQRQINVYSAVIRETLSYNSKTWIQQTADRIVRRIRRMSKRRGKQPLVLIDVPEDASLRGTPLQRTLLSFRRYFENILSWYGVYWKEERLYSTKCPRCGERLVLKRRTKRMRVMICPRCGFEEDRDRVPLCWALSKLPALKGEASNL